MSIKKVGYGINVEICVKRPGFRSDLVKLPADQQVLVKNLGKAFLTAEGFGAEVVFRKDDHILCTRG